MWALVAFGPLAPQDANGMYPNGFFSVGQPNQYQRARGIDRVLTYHSPGLVWNHGDVLDINACPRPLQEQPEASVLSHGPYYTWPTKQVAVIAAAEAQGPVSVQGFLQAYATTIGAPAPPLIQAANPVLPAPIPVFVPAFIPAQQLQATGSAPTSSPTAAATATTTAATTGTAATAATAAASRAAAARAAAARAAAEADAAEAEAEAYAAATIVPTASTAMMSTPPHKSTKARSDGKENGSFVSTFNVLVEDSEASEAESEPTARHSRSKSPVAKALASDDEEPLVAATPVPLAAIEGTKDEHDEPVEAPSASSETTMSFASPTILRKKGSATKPRSKKTPINKTLTFEEDANVIEPVAHFNAGFDITTLFETEAIEDKLDYNVKRARRLLKNSKEATKAQKKRAAERKKEEEALASELAASSDQKPKKKRAAGGRLKKKEVIEIADSSEDWEDFEEAERPEQEA